MNTVALNVAVALATLATLALVPTARAQFVKGNEAVRITSAGKTIETPPVPRSASPVCAANANCHAGSWRMVDTPDGLVECTEPWARAGSCRSSSYGTKKLPRVWVVKHGGEWLQCQYPDLKSKCVAMFARPPANSPYDAVQ